MDTKLVFSVIILIILISIQYTLNLILKELRDMKRMMLKNTKDID